MTRARQSPLSGTYMIGSVPLLVHWRMSKYLYSQVMRDQERHMEHVTLLPIGLGKGFLHA